MDVKKLEPAERDPAKLRRTAFGLVAFMIFGGIYLLISYNKYQAAEAERDGDRPSYKHQVKNIGFVTEEGKIHEIAELQGRVWIAFATTKAPQDESQATIEAARWLAEQFKDDPKNAPAILAFVLDVDADKPAELAEVLPSFPKEITVWRVASGESKTPVKEFLKNSMRFGEVPRLKDGKWEYDTNLMLLDQQAKVRGLASGAMSFDFETVSKMEAKYAKAEKEHPGEKLNPLPMTSNKFRKILYNAVKYLNEHPPGNPEK